MNTTLNPFIQLSLCLIAALGTYTLIHRYFLNPIRASALITFLFCLVVMLLDLENLQKQEALFFGATFVGMSSNDKLGKLGIIYSTSFYMLLYILLAGLLNGIGGALGTIAFLACSTVLLIKKYLLKI